MLFLAGLQHQHATAVSHQDKVTKIYFTTLRVNEPHGITRELFTLLALWENEY